MGDYQGLDGGRRMRITWTVGMEGTVSSVELRLAGILAGMFGECKHWAAFGRYPERRTMLTTSAAFGAFLEPNEA